MNKTNFLVFLTLCFILAHGPVLGAPTEAAPPLGVSSEEHSIQDLWSILKFSGPRIRSVEYETRARRFRDEGLKFFELHPANPIRWSWLNTALLNVPTYLKDPVKYIDTIDTVKNPSGLFDEDAQRLWDIKYLEFRAELMGSSEKEAMYFRPIVLTNELNEAIRKVELGIIPDSSQTIIRLYDYATTCQDQEAARLATHLASVLEAKGRMQELKALVVAMKSNANVSIQQWADGQQQKTKLADAALGLKFRALDGQEVDLAQMRNKVILIEGWTSWCHGCIDAMPQIKDLYAKYRDQGFEVVGICFIMDSKRDEAATNKIMAEYKPNWPMLVLRDGDVKQFWDRYGITGVPLTLLLGKGGRLESSAFQRPEELEAKVRELLSLKPAKTGT